MKSCSYWVNWPLSFLWFAMQIALNLLLIFILNSSQHANYHSCGPSWSFQLQGVPQWPSSTLRVKLSPSLLSMPAINVCHCGTFSLMVTLYQRLLKSSKPEKPTTTKSWWALLEWKTLTEYSQAWIARASYLLHVGPVDAELTALELNCDHLHLNLF